MYLTFNIKLVSGVQHNDLTFEMFDCEMITTVSLITIHHLTKL